MVDFKEEPIIVVGGGGTKTAFHPCVGEVVAHHGAVGIREGHIIEVATHNHIGIALINHLPNQGGFFGMLAECAIDFAHQTLAGFFGLSGFALGFQIG